MYFLANDTKIRQFTVVQFEFNPRTGEKISDFDVIISGLKKYKSITKWAYCIHDKDVYTQDAIDDMNYTLEQEAKQKGLKDEAAINEYMKNNAWCQLGSVKGRHIHIVANAKGKLSIATIARWLSVPEYLVNVIKGKGAFLDCVQYLTHEDEDQQKLGKYRYDDSEVFTSASCRDWRKQLDSRKVDEEKYGVGKTREQKYIIDVAKYGKTLNECCRELSDDIDLYVAWSVKLQKARQEYLSKLAVLPNTRISIYVYGAGGVGKDVFCELLASALFPDKPDIRDVLFGVGDGVSTFDGYDGQPVITWSEMRASNLLSFVGRRSVLTVLDPHPKLQSGNVNIKFGNTKLIHEYNIINGVDHWTKFISELAKGYLDKNAVIHHDEKSNMEQFYRRIPIIVWIQPDRFSISINEGVFSGSRNFVNYQLYKEVSGSFAELQALCGADKELLKKLSTPLISHVLEVIQFLRNKLDVPELSRSDIYQHLLSKNYGAVLKSGNIKLFDEPKEDSLDDFVTICDG